MSFSSWRLLGVLRVRNALAPCALLCGGAVLLALSGVLSGPRAAYAVGPAFVQVVASAHRGGTGMAFHSLSIPVAHATTAGDSIIVSVANNAPVRSPGRAHLRARTTRTAATRRTSSSMAASSARACVPSTTR